MQPAGLLFMLASAIILVTGDRPAIKIEQQQVASPPTQWRAVFTPSKLEAHMETQVQVLLDLKNVDVLQHDFYFKLLSNNPKLAAVNNAIYPNNISSSNASWSGNITIDAIFIGQTNILVGLINTSTNIIERSSDMLEITITRKQRIIDHVFTGAVVLLVSLLYINFGAALDLSVLHVLITRPVGPAIGFIAQFLFMPLVSYALGYIIFANEVEMQLGLFFTGVSPSGGASNIWSVILGGNINLSVLMTTVSNFAAFGMMPLWIFTLGQTIFDRGNLHVPYTNIATFAAALVIPLCIGVVIQKTSPRATRFLVRLLKPISSCLIIFIIIFATVTNLYLFQLFSWRIVLSGLGLPWLGYAFGYLLAKSLKQTNVDSLTIAIETGIQNTGISIFLLRLSLMQPHADLTTVIPVAVAIMTPLPLLALYIYKRYSGRNIKNGILETDANDIGQHSN